MPVQVSNRVVTDDLSRTASRAEGRSHWIRVYRDSLSRAAASAAR
jgi:hypothetical protein